MKAGASDGRIGAGCSGDVKDKACIGSRSLRTQVLSSALPTDSGRAPSEIEKEREREREREREIERERDGQTEGEARIGLRLEWRHKIGRTRSSNLSMTGGWETRLRTS